MENTQQEILDIFTKTNALLRGHFVLRSGLHSGHFFQCAKVGESMKAIERLSELLVEKLCALDYSTVLAPAMGGLVMGQEVARQTDSRYIFAEKVDDKLSLRRGFKIAPGEKILIVEDVVTRGGRVQEAVDIIQGEGGHVAGIAVLVDRSNRQTSFDAPFISLLELSFPTYQADQLPAELAQIPVEKPGS